MKKTQGNKKTAKAFEDAATDHSGHRYVLRLFVTGMSSRSQRAIENIRELCEEHLKGRYDLEVIDLYQHPDSARENQLLAAPTLIKKLPLPLRKFVGDMTSTHKILAGLDLQIEREDRTS